MKVSSCRRSVAPVSPATRLSTPSVVSVRPVALYARSVHFENPRFQTASLWRLSAAAETGEAAPREEQKTTEVATRQREGFGQQRQDRRPRKDFEERVVEISRVATTVKGGRKLRFRAVMVVGDGKGTVGVGNASAKEIPVACRKATKAAMKELIKVPLNKHNLSFPHRQEAKFSAAKVMLRPAAEGTGVIAGGSVRTVLEVAGVRNGFGKILNSGNAMNNAKATVKALSEMRTLDQVAKSRGVSIDYLLGKTADPENDPSSTPTPEETPKEETETDVEPAE